MKIIVIGGSGTIGSHVVNELSPRHEIIIVGYKRGDIQVDIESPDSIQKMFEKIGTFDSLVITAGKVHFAPLLTMTTDTYLIGLNNKLMGQVQCVLIGTKYMKDNGSFTLTSGILSDDPIKEGSSASMVNGAINCFVIGAAIELPRGIRINAISPTIVTESISEFGPYFRGFQSVTAKDVAVAYSKSVEGSQTGHIYTVWK